MPEPVNLAAALATFTDHWAQRKIAEVNDYEIKLAKVQGEFVWHKHDDTDEPFLVISGRLTIQLRDGDVALGPGELYVVPRGVEHCPRADEETAILLVEPKGTVNTGDAAGDRTVGVREL
ncbi:cupin domain-containing protein [Kitasatospora azatica]|uniref:cupin domain-containing protein n=1 Tax=Kitasatospora azatica TaxID=58347 RepID=UPI00056AFC60|nr:cupin domain-containing protein [Kitasatospora azatica]